MKKILTVYVTTLLCCLLLFAPVGCSESLDQGLQGGDSVRDPAPAMSVSYTTNVSKLKIGNHL